MPALEILAGMEAIQNACERVRLRRKLSALIGSRRRLFPLPGDEKAGTARQFAKEAGP
jgi:hypothetical protein